MREHLQHYINGAFVDSEGGKRHEVINPATEEACAVITLGSQADVDKAVAAARPRSRLSPRRRWPNVRRCWSAFWPNTRTHSDFAAVIAEEMGAPISFAGTAQVGAGIRLYSGHAGSAGRL